MRHVEWVVFPLPLPVPTFQIYGKPGWAGGRALSHLLPQPPRLPTDQPVTDLPLGTSCSRQAAAGGPLLAESSWDQVSLTILFQNRWFSRQLLLIKCVWGQMVINQEFSANFPGMQTFSPVVGDQALSLQSHTCYVLVLLASGL